MKKAFIIASVLILFVIAIIGSAFFAVAKYKISQTISVANISINKQFPYQIKFYGNTATSGEMENQQLIYNKEATLTPNSFIKTGYIFNGWNTKEDGTGTIYTDKQTILNLTEEADDIIELYAQWKVKKILVTFNANTGVGDDKTQTFTYGVANQSFTDKGYTKKGYTQTGWGLNTTTKSWNITNGVSDDWIDRRYPNITLYAIWSKDTYTISYTLNGGTQSNPKTSYQVDTADFTLVNPTKTGYTFAGWTGSNGTTKQTTVKIAKGTTGNKSYTANYTANSYSIKFNANNGSGTMSNLAMTYDTAKNLTANSFTRSGYTFNGWNTKANGSGTAYTNKQSVKNLSATSGGTVNLYAQWKGIAYTIAFNANNGSGTMSNLAMTYGTAKNLTANSFTRSGYTFNGWNTKANGSGTAYTNKQSVNNLTTTSGATITLYAQWVQNVYEYNYTGTVQTFTAPVSGTYKLEVYGGQGGNPQAPTEAGGKGGYAKGTVTLTKGTVLYVVVGGRGGTPTTKNGGTAGYNGGGAGGNTHSSYGLNIAGRWWRWCYPYWKIKHFIKEYH